MVKAKYLEEEVRMEGYKVEIKTELNYQIERHAMELRKKEKLEKECNRAKK